MEPLLNKSKKNNEPAVGGSPSVECRTLSLTFFIPVVGFLLLFNTEICKDMDAKLRDLLILVCGVASLTWFISCSKKFCADEDLTQVRSTQSV